MIPRPAKLEEPDFSQPHLTRTTLWGRKTGHHGMPGDEFREKYFRGTFDSTRDDNRYTTFLFSDHDISDDHTWVPDVLVGHGGFGMAGLWRAKNDEGATVDEVVIKQVTTWKTNEDDTSEMFNKIKREAIVNRDAQRQARVLLQARMDAGEEAATADHQIIHLRNYKYNRRIKTCRFYSIYAPYYTLDELLARYRCWNAFVPELFLWHVAWSLAKAAKALSRPPHGSSLVHEHPLYNKGYSQKCSIIHMDLKPNNIFLDYAPINDEQIEAMYSEAVSDEVAEHNPIDTYPTVKLADFGLSVYSGPRNAGEFGGGTPGYYPPEQLNWGYWFSPQNRPINPAESFTAKHNTWAIGRVLYDFVTMNPVDDLERIVTMEPLERLRQREYLENGNHYLPDRYCSDIVPYSLALQRLVRDCLSPRPGDRPDTDQLEARTLAGLIEARQRVYHGTVPIIPGHSSLYRVYYRGNEIHHMPLGPLPGDPNSNDWARATHRDPNGSPLRLPEQVWKAWLDVNARKAPAPISLGKIKKAVQISQQKYDDEARKQHEKILAARRLRRADLTGRPVPQPPATTGPTPAPQANWEPRPAPNRPFSRTRSRNDVADLLAGLADIENGREQQNGGDSGPPVPDRAVLSSSDENEDPIPAPYQRQTPSQTQPVKSSEPTSSKLASAGQPPSGEYQLQIQQTPSSEYQPPEQPPVLPPQHQALVDQQPPNAPVQAQPQLPSSEQYDRMIIREMVAELKDRRVTIPQPARAGGYVKKSEYKRKLQEADQAGKTGRGAWKVKKRRKRKT